MKPESDQRRWHRGALIAEPQICDFGAVAKGGYAKTSVRLANSGSTVIEIRQWKSSCECLAIEPRSVVVHPERPELMTLILDLSHDANYIGDFAPTITGYDGKGEVVVTLTAAVSVKEFRHKVAAW